MKLKIVLLALVGAAGATASFALAAPSHHGRGHEKNSAKDQPCSRAVVFGATTGPQSFTVTVKHAGRHSQFKVGDVVTVSVGAPGQNVEVTGLGCANGSTLQAGAALLRVRLARNPGTTTETSSTQTSTTGDQGKGRHHHDPHGGTTTTSGTTTSDTTTAETTTSDTTTSNGDTTTSDNSNGDTTTSDTTTTSGDGL
jgi:hypothetical protein